MNKTLFFVGLFLAILLSLSWHNPHIIKNPSGSPDYFFDRLTQLFFKQPYRAVDASESDTQKFVPQDGQVIEDSTFDDGAIYRENDLSGNGDESCGPTGWVELRSYERHDSTVNNANWPWQTCRDEGVNLFVPYTSVIWRESFPESCVPCPGKELVAENRCRYEYRGEYTIMTLEKKIFECPSGTFCENGACKRYLGQGLDLQVDIK
jgi:hypothetical protein